MPRPTRIRTQRPSYIERKLSKASLKKGSHLSMRKSKTTVEISKNSGIEHYSGQATASLMNMMTSPEMPKSVVKQVNYHWKTLRKTSVVTSVKSLEDHETFQQKSESEKVLNRIKAMKNTASRDSSFRERKNSLVSTDIMLEKIKQIKREKSCDSIKTTSTVSRRNSRISILDQVDQSYETKKSIKRLTASKMLEKVPKIFQRDKSSDSVEDAKLATASALASRRSSRVSIMDQVESYHNVTKTRRLSKEKIVEKIKRSTESLSSKSSSQKQQNYGSRRCSIMDQVEAYHKPRDNIKKMVFSHLTRRASLVTNWFKDQEKESMLSGSQSNGFLACQGWEDQDDEDESGIGFCSFDSLPFIDDDEDCSNGANLSSSPSTSMPSTSGTIAKILPTLSCAPKSLKVVKVVFRVKKVIQAHCSKSSFFVQKFNFYFPKKLSIFWGEKLVKMLWFWTF